MPQPQQRPQKLGPLTLDAKIGDDPTRSNVWKGSHPDRKKPVAVKLFPSPFGGTPEAQARFHDECGTLKRLRHPSIAKCFGGGIEGNQAYLVYEFVRGETLAETLRRRGRLSWEAVLDMAIPLAQGLVAAHAQNIVHGAIRPDKIIIEGIAPVLLDFRADRAGSFYRNPHADGPADLALHPPEAIADPRAISPAGDTYSLAAVMFLCLTGRPPVSGQTIAEVSANAAKEIPPKVSTIALDCPVWVSSIIEQALRKDPLSRQHDARAFELQLADAKHRSLQSTGFADSASQGFTPLSATQRQTDKEEARKLLGRDSLRDDSADAETTPLHERAWVLVAALLVTIAAIAWALWPLSEDQLRARAEALLAQSNRSAQQQAKQGYLLPMLKRFPEGKHAAWAAEQIDQIEMDETLQGLEMKLKRGLPLTGEVERNFAEALRYQRFGDLASALDRFRGIEKLFASDPQAKPYVGLAKREIAALSRETNQTETTRIINDKLREAEALAARGNTDEAKQLWTGVIELYGDRQDLAPLVEIAKSKLQP